MRLSDALGLPWEEAFEEGSSEADSLFSALSGGVQDFLAAGGTITLVDWCGFSPLEREAAISAGQKRDAIIATSIGLAAQGAHAEILSRADNGDMLIADALDSVLEEMEQRK